MTVASLGIGNLISLRVSSFAVEWITASSFNRKLRQKDALAKGVVEIQLRW